MPDISMCGSTTCPKRLLCYRFIARACRIQSYFAPSPDSNGYCEHYWPADKYQLKDYKERNEDGSQS